MMHVTKISLAIGVLVISASFVECRLVKTSRLETEYIRRLKVGEREVCNYTASDAFSDNAFGPSNTSLFYGVESGYLYETSGELITVDIESLAGYYKESAVEYGFAQANETFGRQGEHTEEILSQHARLKEFWKIASYDDVLVGGIHSEDLKDNLAFAVAAWAKAIYNITNDDFSNVAEQVAEVIETELPNSYSNPILTYEAFTVPFAKIYGFENATLILIGDGDLDFYEFLGLGTVGNDLVHAHEFSHAIQAIMDPFLEYDSPEESRFFELEADAMAAYFLAHEQGRNFEVPLLMDVSKVTFAFGDCEFDNNDHHGTPKQRECAALWAADEGLDMTGDPVSMREFRALFEQNIDLILALDPSVCQLSE